MKINTANSLLVIASLLCAAMSFGADNEPALRYQGIAHDAFYDMCFNANQGLMVGAFGTVVTSSDRGKKWHKTEPFTPLSLFGVTCNKTHNLVVGQQGSIYRQQRGQQQDGLQLDGLQLDGQWLPIQSGSKERLFSVAMNNRGLAVAVGGFGTVLRSQDFGETWQSVSFDWEAVVGDFVEPHLYDVNVADDGEITIVGEFELILRSSNEGKSWQKLRQGDSSLFALTLHSSDKGYAVGQNGMILQTLDGGQTWQRLNPPVTANFLGVSSSVDGQVLVTGIRSLLRSANNGKTWVEIKNNDIAVGWYQATATVGATEMMIAGHSGRILSVNQ
jgi:photosystem II stability/assembly factor-like uncharacterized protein